MVALFLVMIIVIGIPVAWLVSEFKSQTKVRCTLGILAILSSFALAWAAAQVVRLEYNAWYGQATSQLIQSTIENLQNGNTEAVIYELKRLQNKYKPEYETKAHYDELVKETINKLEQARGNHKGDVYDPNKDLSDNIVK